MYVDQSNGVTNQSCLPEQCTAADQRRIVPIRQRAEDVYVGAFNVWNLLYQLLCYRQRRVRCP